MFKSRVKQSGLSLMLFALLFCFVLPANAVTSLCPMGNLSETDGERRIALIVGVGEYKNADITDLKGPPNDAQQIYDLLTGPKEVGYVFPKENVCMLINEDATTQRVVRAFDRFLVQGVREGKNDIAVFYYSGHGSQIKDFNGDETDDRCDETFLLHDARTGSGQEYIGDLVDDELHKMLEQLYAKTKRATVILDSCNSGTATRGTSGLVARWQNPEDSTKACPKVVEPEARMESSWRPQAMPNLVVLTAASDGTSAIEMSGQGIFTKALLKVLTQGTDAPLTYAQISRQVPPLVAADSYQIPYFQGDLNRSVFGATGSRRPFGWDVKAVDGKKVKLSGVPLPGMGEGTEFRIYDGAITGSAANDPEKAKATVVVTKSTRINADAVVSSPESDDPAKKIKAGDLAVMIRPSDEAQKIKVRLRHESEDGGIPPDGAEKLKNLIEANEEAAMFIDIVKDGDSFELNMDSGKLVLRGPENNIRNRYDSDSAVPDSLWQHARQKAFRMLRGEGGADFTDYETLKVQLIPARKQKDGIKGKWEQAPPNSEQVIPVNHSWNVHVKLSAEARKDLLIGGLVLSSDGSSYGFPCDGMARRLKPGQSVTFNARPGGSGCPMGETFVGVPPLYTQDHVIVFGTQETNPVPWHLMTETARTRSARAKGGPLYRALDRYIRPGTRGQALMILPEDVEDTTWTLSSLTMRVVQP